MIPTIETICEDLKAGTISVQQAIAWLHQHAEGAANDLRDAFAMAALPALIAVSKDVPNVNRFDVSGEAYHFADAMLNAREPQHDGTLSTKE